jgi:hypothetical protein
MGTSPVVSKVALAHSASHVDLSVLSRDGGGDNEGSENKSSDNGDEVCLPMHYSHLRLELILVFESPVAATGKKPEPG